MRRKRNRVADKSRIPIPVLERPGKRYYQNKMKWLLDFINIGDIDQLTDGESIEKLTECHGFIMNRHSMNEEMFRSLSSAFRKGTRGRWDIVAIRQFLKGDRDFFRMCFDDIIRYCAEGDPCHEFEYLYHEVPPQHVWIAHFNDSKEFGGGKKLVAIPEWPKDTLDQLRLRHWPNRQALIELLSRFDLERIRKCQHADCGRYFFKKYKTRKKATGDYCSERCRNRGKQMAYRARHREKYNINHRLWRKRRKKPKFEAKCRQCGYATRLTENEVLQLPQKPHSCPDCGGYCLYTVSEYLGRGDGNYSEDYGYIEFIDELRDKGILADA